MILEQKNLKISDEIETLKKEEDRMIRNVNKLHTEVLTLNDNLNKKRGNKHDMDRLNEIIQHEYVNKLKVKKEKLI